RSGPRRVRPSAPGPVPRVPAPARRSTRESQRIVSDPPLEGGPMKFLSAAVVLFALAVVPNPTPLTQSWMFDDFEAGDHASAHGLTWIGIGDDLLGNASRITLERVAGGARGAGHALRLTGSVGEKAPAFTGAWAPLEGGGRPVDLG